MRWLPLRADPPSKLCRTGIPCYKVLHNAVVRGAARTVIDVARMVAGDFAECAACHSKEYWCGYLDGLPDDGKGPPSPPPSPPA